MQTASQNRNLVRIIIASQLVPPFMFAGVAVTLPTMGTDLGAGAITLGLVETIFLASQLAFLLPIGRLGDASCKASLYKFGMFAYAITSLLIAFSSAMPVILLLRFMQGICSAIFAVIGVAMLADLVPPERRGRAYGASISAIYAGLMLGPLLGGWLVDVSGWRAVYMAGGVALLLTGLVILRIMPGKLKLPTFSAVNLPSSGLLLSSIAALVTASALSHLPYIAGAFALAGTLLAASFIRLQNHVEKPLVRLARVRANAPLSTALLIQMLLYINTFAATFMLSLYLQVTQGYSALIAGQILVVGTIVMTVIAPLSGRLADRTRPRIVSTIGVVAMLLATLLGVFLVSDSPLPYILTILAAQGFGFGLFSSPNMKTIMNSIPPELSSIASALAACSRSLGMVMGMLAVNTLIAIQFGNAPLEENPLKFVDTITITYGIMTVGTIAALLLSLGSLIQTKRDKNP